MAAKDYKICLALFDAFIAKVSKRNPDEMTVDRRKIEEEEIMMLIDWYLDREADDGEHGIIFDSNAREGMMVELRFKKKEDVKQ